MLGYDNLIVHHNNSYPFHSRKLYQLSTSQYCRETKIELWTTPRCFFQISTANFSQRVGHKVKTRELNLARDMRDTRALNSQFLRF